MPADSRPVGSQHGSRPEDGEGEDFGKADPPGTISGDERRLDDRKQALNAMMRRAESCRLTGMIEQ
jgi:hypothetical protein